MEKMDKVSLIIPSYKPDDKLLNTVSDAVAGGFTDIIVVDDGGGEKYRKFFDRVKEFKECTLLCHEVNKGKGAALKTAMEYFLEQRPDFAGVVTADADGQHKTSDIIAVAKQMTESNRITLGYRNFNLPHVPKKSRYGNKITCGVFGLFFGMRLKDTQTGLRAFPRDVIETMLSVKGDRYEYETQMLIRMSRDRIPYEQVGIETVYIEENKSSHFRPVADSIRIYGIIIKYLFSAVLSTAVDALTYFLLKLSDLLSVIPIPQTYTASYVARAISSLVNFAVNSKVVFGEKLKLVSMVKYYILVVLQITVSAFSVHAIEKLLHIDSATLSTLIKLAVDTVLFFCSFRIQHKWVFNNKSKKQEDSK